MKPWFFQKPSGVYSNSIGNPDRMPELPMLREAPPDPPKRRRSTVRRNTARQQARDSRGRWTNQGFFSRLGDIIHGRARRKISALNRRETRIVKKPRRRPGRVQSARVPNYRKSVVLGLLSRIRYGG